MLWCSLGIREKEKAQKKRKAFPMLAPGSPVDAVAEAVHTALEGRREGFKRGMGMP